MVEEDFMILTLKELSGYEGKSNKIPENDKEERLYT